MTALAASLPFPRPRRERLPFGAALLSLAGHALAAALLLLSIYALAPATAPAGPEERAVEVVMVPAAAPTPQPEALEPPANLIPLPDPPPPNLDASTPLAERSVLPRAAQPQALVRAAEPAPEATSPQPEATAEAAAARAREAAPAEEPAAEPEPNERASTEIVVAQAPRIVPRRVEVRPRPEPRAEGGPRGELRELDLFGPGRQGPRQAAASRGGAPQSEGREASRSDSDFILAQILRRWRINYRDERYRDVVFAPGNLVLNRDGTLTYPYGKNDPWNPYAMMDGYGFLTRPGSEDVRRAVDTFFVALREAQPFQLPPTPGPYPRRIRISFRASDL